MLRNFFWFSYYNNKADSSNELLESIVKSYPNQTKFNFFMLMNKIFRKNFKNVSREINNRGNY